MHTLFLNKDGSPISILPLSVGRWQDAVRLYYSGKVHILKNYENWQIHSPSITLNVPSIVITTNYLKSRLNVKYSRGNVYLRDDYTCGLCGQCFVHDLDILTLDHVVPKSKGGKTNWANITTACKPCNSSKGNDETIVPKLLPYRPTYFQLLNKRKKYPINVHDMAWNDFLGWDEKLLKYSPPNRYV